MQGGIFKEKGKTSNLEDFHLIIEQEQNVGGLYLGNARCAVDYEVLKKEKLSVVLDVAGIDHKYPEGTVAGHKVVKALDSPDFDLSACFDECFQFIDEHRGKGHNVLVHCVAGVSRSATIVIAYLMQSQDIDLWQAQDDVRRLRSVIRPNQDKLEIMDIYSENNLPSEKTNNLPNYHMILKPSDNLGGLFLGNLKISQDLDLLKQLEMRAVLDMAGLNFLYPEEHNIKCQSLKTEDEPDFDLSIYFKNCFDFIHEHRVKGENVLVHCRVGKSRSATIVIGYLMHSQKIDFQTAYEFVREIRSIAQPNEGFVEQLKKLEQSMTFEEKILE